MLRFKGGDEKSAVTGDCAMMTVAEIWAKVYVYGYVSVFVGKGAFKVVRRSSVSSVSGAAVRRYIWMLRTRTDRLAATDDSLGPIR